MKITQNIIFVILCLISSCVSKYSNIMQKLKKEIKTNKHKEHFRDTIFKSPATYIYPILNLHTFDTVLNKNLYSDIFDSNCKDSGRILVRLDVTTFSYNLCSFIKKINIDCYDQPYPFYFEKGFNYFKIDSSLFQIKLKKNKENKKKLTNKINLVFASSDCLNEWELEIDNLSYFFEDGKLILNDIFGRKICLGNVEFDIDELDFEIVI